MRLPSTVYGSWRRGQTLGSARENYSLLKFTKGWEQSAKPRPARFWRRVMLATDQESSGYESFDDTSVKAD